MFSANLETDGNKAVLRLVTHYGKDVAVSAEKASHQQFRLSYTGVSDIAIYPGAVVKVDRSAVHLECNGQIFIGIRLCNEPIEIGDAATAYEHYFLTMEEQRPGLLVTKKDIAEPRMLFINVDCLDGGDNLIKRYRISPYTGECLVIIHG